MGEPEGRHLKPAKRTGKRQKAPNEIEREGRIVWPDMWKQRSGLQKDNPGICFLKKV